MKSTNIPEINFNIIAMKCLGKMQLVVSTCLVALHKRSMRQISLKSNVHRIDQNFESINFESDAHQKLRSHFLLSCDWIKFVFNCFKRILVDSYSPVLHFELNFLFKKFCNKYPSIRERNQIVDVLDNILLL